MNCEDREKRVRELRSEINRRGHSNEYNGYEHVVMCDKSGVPQIFRKEFTGEMYGMCMEFKYTQGW